MGIDLHNLQFLAHAQDLGVSFQRTLAIGRQAVFVDAPDLLAHQRLRQLPPLQPGALAPGQLPYFEPLFKQWLGAEHTDSVDASPYEQATVVHDMNLPWQAAEAAASYDAVLDFGCLEHVFDFPTAWRNCVNQVRVGGHILHALPANNLSGHGFYQFSPELFFNLYQRERGWDLRGVWFAMKAEPDAWWQVANPRVVKRRVNLCNGHEVYVMVLAKKLHEAGALPAPQQSDYADIEWSGSGDALRARQPSALQAPLATLGVLGAARRGREWLRALRRAGLSLPAPDYQRVDVPRLLRK